MKFLVDDKVAYELNDTKCKVLCDEIPHEVFRSDMERRVAWIIETKYHDCFKKLKDKWDPLLKNRGIEFIPTNEDKYAELVFSQPDYISARVPLMQLKREATTKTLDKIGQLRQRKKELEEVKLREFNQIKDQ